MVQGIPDSLNIKQKDIEKAEILIEALPYIQRFNGKIIVIKCGGSLMDDYEQMAGLIEDVVLLKVVGFKPIIVHGGGKEISYWIDKTGLETKFINGLRVTDESTLEIVEMALAKVNGAIVRIIESLGEKAMGVSGKSGGLFKAVKRDPDDEGEDLGFVGSIIGVNGKVLNDMLDNGYLPVVYPLAMDDEYNTYNINADDAACAVAKVLKAEKLAFLSDVPGVLLDRDDPDSFISEMYTDEVKSLIDEEKVVGGMIPKLLNCVDAINKGVNRVHILDGRIPHSLLLEFFTDRGTGTAIMSGKEFRYYKQELSRKEDKKEGQKNNG